VLETPASSCSSSSSAGARGRCATAAAGGGGIGNGSKAPPRLTSLNNKTAGSDGGVLGHCYANIGRGTNLIVEGGDKADDLTNMITTVVEFADSRTQPLLGC